jgi:hypothetical protein
MLQVQCINVAHECQITRTDRSGLAIDAASADADQMRLPFD